MRVLAMVAIIAIASMTIPAYAQMGMGKEDQMGADKGRRPPPRPPGEHPVKADENAYKDALKRIPQSHEKKDPWKSVR